MMRKNWSTATVGTCVLIALLACKKGQDEEQPAASAAPEPSASAIVITPTEAPKEEGPKIGDVTRYEDKEKESEGAVKVLEEDVKVFNETDNTKPHVATLSKDIMVFRVASVEADEAAKEKDPEEKGWVLIEFPSGVGQLSKGWVEAKHLSENEDEKVTRDEVTKQSKVATISPTAKTDDGAKTADEKKGDEKTADTKGETKDDKKTTDTKDGKTADTKGDKKTADAGINIDAAIDDAKKKGEQIIKDVTGQTTTKKKKKKKTE